MVGRILVSLIAFAFATPPMGTLGFLPNLAATSSAVLL
jgi:hypothetical protein